jgi:hypothetical protein
MDGWACPGSRRGVRKRTAVPPTGVANLTIRLCPRNKTPGASRPPIQKTSLTTDPGTDLEIGLCLNHKPRTLVSPTHNSPGAPYPRISCLGWWGPRNFMRFSLEKTAHANAGWGCVQEIRVSRSFFARCGTDGPRPWFFDEEKAFEGLRIRPTYAGANVGHPSSF